jgi:phosphatidylglycerophosphatase A
VGNWPNSRGKELRHLIIALASAGYAGFIPRGPGTAGTLVGVLAYSLYSSLPLLPYSLTTAAFFCLACWTAGKAEGILGEKDSPKIVIDEVAGYLIAMAFLPPSAALLASGFLFFRVLDIMKPPPLRWIHAKMTGGLAVVLDDAVAGVYTNLLLRLILFYLPESLFILGE